MEAKDFKYNNEELVANLPKDTIVCKECPFAANDIMDGDRVVMYGYKGSVCKKYPKGTFKPNGILFRNEPCPYRK